ncbi:MAG: transglycosylase domain-containing protein [Rubrobacter sp.]|nr:transglycosylase domain-containing protein [Rubrobacter sp.]
MARTYPRNTGRGGGGSKDPKRSAQKRPSRQPAKSTKAKGSKNGASRFKRIRNIVLRTFGVLLLAGFVAGVFFLAGGYLGLVRSVSQLEAPQNVETHPTYIYSAPLGDSEGSRRVIGTIFQGENRKTASLDEMPSHLLNALVAKEDERFREHAGVDLWGIMRALYVDIRAGEAREGASTITQQYVRNAYLSQEVSVTRKIKEALIAIQIETVEEKDDILADYLNTAYFGNNAYGIEAASETYFNKSVSDLTVSESATLIGLVWSPSTLGEDKEAAQAQRDIGLERMFSTGYINRQDYDAALAEPMPEEWPTAPMIETGLTGPQITRNFTELVQEELVNRYGANTVVQGGLSVNTTLDLQAQSAAQEILYGPTGYLPNESDPDAALVSIEQGTGHIKAMVGNRDQEAQFNLVTQAQRQPGSSFKPFAYIAALEQGLDPSTEFISEEKEYTLPNGEEWEVENYEENERGSISLTEALWQSDNTVFTDLIMNVGGKGLQNGPAAAADVAKRLGITADYGENPHPSIVLGTQEVSPMEQTAAYATIANEGRLVQPTAITSVVRDEGLESEEVLLRDEQPEGEQVIEPEIANEATEAMMGDIMWGIADDAALDGGREAAGKTGTSESFFDSWFLGYTPTLTTGIWMGYGEGGATLEEMMSRDGALYGTIGSPDEIWSDYTEEALEGTSAEEFENVEPPPPPDDIAATQNTTVGQGATAGQAPAPYATAAATTTP